MTNWKEYIENFFNLLNVEFEKKTTRNLITYVINCVYLEFEFLNANSLNKIEIGKEIGRFRSNYKIVFDK